MKRSTERILTTHTGALGALPEDLAAILAAKSAGEPYDPELLAKRQASVAQEMVRRQQDAGLDVVNEGELTRPRGGPDTADRLTGVEWRPIDFSRPMPLGPHIANRDIAEFEPWFKKAQTHGWLLPAGVARFTHRGYVTGPVAYRGPGEVQAEIANLRAAEAACQPHDVFLTSFGPAWLAEIMGNEYYPTEEEYLFAIADALRPDFKAVTDAGFVLQLDEPVLATFWQTLPNATLAEFREVIELRVEAINRSVRGLPADQLRVHVCWSGGHWPHKNDLELKEFIDVLMKLHPNGLCIESSTPRHEHEWAIWEDVKLPDEKVLIPGVVGHYTDWIEHPELVAQRLVNFARVVGRERVIAGTDCGLINKVGDPQVGWEKFRAMSEGARLASEKLWRK